MQWDIANVKDPFLVLAKAVERLIGRREKLLLHLERVVPSIVIGVSLRASAAGSLRIVLPSGERKRRDPDARSTLTCNAGVWMRSPICPIGL